MSAPGAVAPKGLARAPIRHPAAVRTTAFFGILTGLAILVAGLEGLIGTWPVALAFLAVGAAGTWFSSWIWRVLQVTAVHNRATDVLLRGQLDEADALLAPLAKARGVLGQSVALQQSSVALLRGDMKAAEAFATRCIDRSPRVGPTSPKYILVKAATAARAFARASLGDAEGARADIELVRDSDNAHVASLARAAVAELIVLSKASDTEGTIRALTANERVLEYASPRERALVRAFERLVATGGPSVYRKPQTREAEDYEVNDWVARVAPGLQGFSAGSMGQKTVAAAVPIANAAPPPLRAPKRKPVGRVLALWAVLIMMFVGIWQFLSVDAPHSAHAHASAAQTAPIDFGLWPLLVFAALAGAIAIRFRRANLGNARFRALEGRIQLGDPAAAREIEKMSAASAPGTSANAFLILAQEHDRRGEFREALQCAEAGLNRVETSAAMRNAYSDLLAPGLHVQRALAAAAMGRSEEAQKEVANLAGGFPGYAFLSTALLRIGIIDAARAGDFPRAWDIAKTRGADMPISYKDELLCALLRASQEGVDDDERARLSHVLKKNDAARTWVRAVAPRLCESLGLVDGISEKKRISVEAAMKEDEAPDSDELFPESEEPEKKRAKRA